MPRPLLELCGELERKGGDSETGGYVSLKMNTPDVSQLTGRGELKGSLVCASPVA